MSIDPREAALADLRQAVSIRVDPVVISLANARALLAVPSPSRARDLWREGLEAAISAACGWAANEHKGDIDLLGLTRAIRAATPHDTVPTAETKLIEAVQMWVADCEGQPDNPSDARLLKALWTYDGDHTEPCPECDGQCGEPCAPCTVVEAHASLDRFTADWLESHGIKQVSPVKARMPRIEAAPAGKAASSPTSGVTDER